MSAIRFDCFAVSPPAFFSLFFGFCSRPPGPALVLPLGPPRPAERPPRFGPRVFPPTGLRPIFSWPGARVVWPSGSAVPWVVVGRAANFAGRGVAGASPPSTPATEVPAESRERGVRRAIWPLGKIPLARPPGWMRRVWRFVICLKAVAERARRELESTGADILLGKAVE
jgi:hypothetical protein